MPSDMSIPCVRVLEKFAAYLAICTRFVVPTDVISQALIGAHMFTANVTSVDDNFPGMCGGHVFIQQTLFGKSFTTAFGSFAHELSCVFQFVTFQYHGILETHFACFTLKRECLPVDVLEVHSQVVAIGIFLRAAMRTRNRINLRSLFLRG